MDDVVRIHSNRIISGVRDVKSYEVDKDFSSKI